VSVAEEQVDFCRHFLAARFREDGIVVAEEGLKSMPYHFSSSLTVEQNNLVFILFRPVLFTFYKYTKKLC
jgi:hypothetical protein